MLEQRGRRPQRALLHRIRLQRPRPPTPSQTCTPQPAPCAVWRAKFTPPHPPSLHLAMLPLARCTSWLRRMPLHFWHTPQLMPGCVPCGTHNITQTPTASTVPSEQGFLRQRFAHERTPAHCRASAVAVGQAARNNLMLWLCDALCATHTTPAPMPHLSHTGVVGAASGFQSEHEMAIFRCASALYPTLDTADDYFTRVAPFRRG